MWVGQNFQERKRYKIMGSYIVVNWGNQVLEEAIRLIQIDVNEFVEQGYVLAGPLIHTASFDNDMEWHILLQPMILKDIK